MLCQCIYFKNVNIIKAALKIRCKTVKIFHYKFLRKNIKNKLNMQLHAKRVLILLIFIFYLI